MRGPTWAVVALFSVGAFLAVQAGQKTAEAERKRDLTQLKKFHSEASLAVTKGDKSLDDPLPPQMREDFALQMPVQTGKSASTYRDLIVKSEDVFVQSGSRVTVSVDAQPHSCNVTYRAIAGGGTLDFGVTRAQKRVEPRTYEFTCDCTSPPKPHKTVDCTEDQDVQFDCRQ